MEYREYRRHDAVGLARLVEKGEVSAAELLEVALARADAVDGTVNAIHLPMREIARSRARTALTGPFAGVPFLVKDLGQHYAGLPTGSGSRSLATRPAEAHALVVQRWLEAGLVVFGKTSTPEFGAKAITEPEVGGPTRNPWNPAHTPGGSSGGSAAAVAAGIVPVAGASDGGGSIRIPAACCGLFGLKPGRGVVPDGPDVAERLHGAAVNGVISRSVRDTAAMLDVLSAPDPTGPYLTARPAAAYTDLAAREPGVLRIGMSTASPLGTPVDPEAVAAVEDAAALLTSLGHDVEPTVTGVDERQLARDFLTMWFAAIAAQVTDARRLTGCGPEGFEIDTQIMAALGRATPAPVYIDAHDRWNDHTRRLAAFHERYDLLLTPTLARPPVRIGELVSPAPVRAVSKALLRARAAGLLGRTGIVDTLVDRNLAPVPYTQLANITGRPAMSVPLYWTPAPLPLGVQFVGPPGSEGRLLALATQLETARPWFDREPPL
ncbi:amidase [Pseudonocardia yuanmonensis]|uniref:Amidase n=1 Tax=Pseudonocardia yuanmonensis TaxID=1095914 RepID=A0ABP8XEM7_9PSEU